MVIFVSLNLTGILLFPNLAEFRDTAPLMLPVISWVSLINVPPTGNNGTWLSSHARTDCVVQTVRLCKREW